MTPLRCAPSLVEETLENLRAAGRRGTEGIVLWLAKRPLTDGSAIAEVYVPDHYAGVDVFRIPPSGMSAMMAHLRARKLGLAAQVHSHPQHAFHFTCRRCVGDCASRRRTFDRGAGFRGRRLGHQFS
ncbi:MAG: hypothetical protein WDN50_03620 [Bradyrhizobium sp.]